MRYPRGLSPSKPRPSFPGRPQRVPGGPRREPGRPARPPGYPSPSRPAPRRPRPVFPPRVQPRPYIPAIPPSVPRTFGRWGGVPGMLIGAVIGDLLSDWSDLYPGGLGIYQLSNYVKQDNCTGGPGPIWTRTANGPNCNPQVVNPNTLIGAGTWTHPTISNWHDPGYYNANPGFLRMTPDEQWGISNISRLMRLGPIQLWPAMTSAPNPALQEWPQPIPYGPPSPMPQPVPYPLIPRVRQLRGPGPRGLHSRYGGYETPVNNNPEPVIETSTSVAPGVRSQPQSQQSPRAVPRTFPRKRSQGTKERKGRLKTLAYNFISLLNQFTEAVDLMNVAYEAIPKYIRDAFVRDHLREFGEYPNDRDRAEFVMANWDRIDLENFVWGYIREQVSDFIAAAGPNSPQGFFDIHGIQRGPWDSNLGFYSAEDEWDWLEERYHELVDYLRNSDNAYWSTQGRLASVVR